MPNVIRFILPSNHEISLIHPSENSTVKIKIAETLYCEYNNDTLIRKEKFQKKNYDLSVILMEFRIKELKEKGYKTVLPPYQPKPAATQATSHAAAVAFSELLKADHNPIASLIEPQLQSMENRRLPSDAEKSTITTYENANETTGHVIDYFDESFCSIQKADHLYVWLTDKDEATLCDSILYRANETSIPELKSVLHYQELNLYQVGMLRLLFHSPEAVSLSYITIACVDSLPLIIEVMADANALHIPVTLRLNSQFDITPILVSEQNDPALAKLNLHALTCSSDAAFLFTDTQKNQLNASSLYGPQYYNLKHLFNKTDDHAIEQLLESPILSQLESLILISENYNYAPPLNHALILKHKDKWKHLKRLLITDYKIPEEIKTELLQYPQIVLVSPPDNYEAEGYLLSMFGFCRAAE